MIDRNEFKQAIIKMSERALAMNLSPDVLRRLLQDFVEGIMIGENEIHLMAQMHKAIAMIQFKLEGLTIKKHPSFQMNHRLLLERINYKDNTINVDGNTYPLDIAHFPTVNPDNPYELLHEEVELLEKLKYSFLNSEKLQKHVSFLYTNGGMYLRFNSNLLYHGCIPLNKDGSFAKILMEEDGIEYSGKALLDRFDRLAREAYLGKENSESKEFAMDMMWYLWTGPLSPLYGKEKMSTFEKYFIVDVAAHIEEKNPYYEFMNDKRVCNMIFEEFGLDPETSHIINGHVPVIKKQGESPIKANGKLLVIDGGFSRAYQGKTGIAGYTLINNSYGLSIVSHSPFETTQKAIEEEKDIISTNLVLEKEVYRKLVGDTDIGEELKASIKDLESLIAAYRKGIIKENRSKKLNYHYGK
jgi:fructose-1,6-bisphosphatase-3